MRFPFPFALVGYCFCFQSPWNLWTVQFFFKQSYIHRTGPLRRRSSSLQKMGVGMEIKIVLKPQDLSNSWTYRHEILTPERTEHCLPICPNFGYKDIVVRVLCRIRKKWFVTVAVLLRKCCHFYYLFQSNEYRSMHNPWKFWIDRAFDY